MRATTRTIPTWTWSARPRTRTSPCLHRVTLSVVALGRISNGRIGRLSEATLSPHIATVPAARVETAARRCGTGTNRLIPHREGQHDGSRAAPGPPSPRHAQSLFHEPDLFGDLISLRESHFYPPDGTSAAPAAINSAKSLWKCRHCNAPIPGRASHRRLLQHLVGCIGIVRLLQTLTAILRNLDEQRTDSESDDVATADEASDDDAYAAPTKEAIPPPADLPLPTRASSIPRPISPGRRARAEIPPEDRDVVQENFGPTTRK